MKPEEAIFADALALPPHARDEFLSLSCGADAMLRRRVEELLNGYEHEGGLLERPPVPKFDASGAGNGFAGVHAAGGRIGRYKLLEQIGEGGFGVVYMAEQEEPVRRRVALKIIKLGMDTREVVARFEAERQALAMMDHPNIATVFDGGATETGRPYFVMELVRGTPITVFCDERRLSVRQRLELFAKVCHAVQHAHQKGVIHRDLKPSNILIARDESGSPGVPKVIDFGIAKATNRRLTERTLFTRFSNVVGTPAYMSPEQTGSCNGDVDTRSDIYSLGVLLYELLTGRTPFDTKMLLEAGYAEIERTIREKEAVRPSTRVSTLAAAEGATIARQRGTDPARLRSWLRGDLDWIVMRCLEKDRARRYETAGTLATDLQRYLRHDPVTARPPSTTYVLRKFVRRHRVGVAAAGAIASVIVIGSVATAVLTLRTLRAERLQAELRVAAQRAAESEAATRLAAGQQERRAERIRWARQTALPAISRLIKVDDIAAAFALACEAEEFIPDDPALVDLWPKIASAASIETTPSGAEVFAKPYRHPAADWEYIGTTPITSVRLARAPYRYQIRKEGFETFNKSDAGFFYERPQWRRLEFALVPLGSYEATPSGMVRVPGNALIRQLTGLSPVALGDYWIDTHEVTNLAFKAFVEAGGYGREEFWEQPFATSDGRVLAWSEAMALFRDESGMPAPATWRNGSYAEGEGDYPVTGVSWFEAAAYARFAGKRLPSIYHWRYAAPLKELEHLIPFSNFRNRGLAPVGHNEGMHVHGTFDMAGNAKEWCWNEEAPGRRYLLGGGWDEQVYMFAGNDARSPFDRSENNGFRCVKLISDQPLDERVDAPHVVKRRDYSQETPVSDAEFEAFKMLYAYDKAPLDAVVESRDESHRQWRSERIAFNAAYNGERMAAIVFLPTSTQPPYQAIVFFPGAGGAFLRSSHEVSEMPLIQPWIEGGRALVYPILKGAYERRLDGPRPAGQSVAERDLVVQRYKDIARTIDYVETRGDIDFDRLAYIGWSQDIGPIISVMEPRLKVNVLIGSGLRDERVMPEVDPFNFASRVSVPTMILDGRYDFFFPLEFSQIPLVNRLGTPPEHKRHVLLESGHVTPVNQTGAEVSAWLDRYLGPVQ